MARETVAAVIPNKNSARTIRATLESLRFCDEVVVVDMFSTDDSKRICAEFPNVRVLERQDYIYANFNFGVDQARTDWIVRLDSDEVLSPELQESIVRVLEGGGGTGGERFDCYDAFCHLYFFGKRLRHGFGNQWRNTLFRKGVASYQANSEHEHLTVTVPVGRLAGHYDHFTNVTIARWIEKINYYTDRDVERVKDPRPTGRWRVTYMVLRNFQRLYFRPGWLVRDGYLGFVVAGVAAFALFIQYAKIWERADAPSPQPARPAD